MEKILIFIIRVLIQTTMYSYALISSTELILKKKMSKKEVLFNSPQTLAEARLTGFENIFRCKKIDDYKVYIEDLDYTFFTEESISENINYIAVRSHDIEIYSSQYDNTTAFKINNIIENPFSYTIFASNKSNKSLEINVPKTCFKFKINDLIYINFSSTTFI